MKILAAAFLAGCLVVGGGCQSPYHADRGALFGGLTGAGVGAIVGDALGDAGAGAVLGAGVGAITGAAVGESLDEIEARNRAQIAAQLGREIDANAVTLQEVIELSRSGVSEPLIITHIEHHGVAQSLSTNDLIFLKENQVSDAVIQAMQRPPLRPQVVATPPPTTTIIEEHHYGPGFGPSFGVDHYYNHRHCGPRTRWGISFSN